MSPTERLLEALRAYGPMTSHELAEETGLLIDSVRPMLSRLHRKQLVHIHSYQRVTTKLSTVYAFGPGVDARKPPPRNTQQRMQLCRERKRCRVASIFHIGPRTTTCLTKPTPASPTRVSR